MVRHTMGTCAVCGKPFPARELVPGELVRPEVAAELTKLAPAWRPAQPVCRADLAKARAAYVHDLLESEKGELSSLENDVLRSLREHELVSTDIEREFDRQWSFGERLADRIAAFGGSWTFLACFGLFLLAWVGMNSFVLWRHPPDPYPYIFLNLLLSCLAAIQAPVIMMSQNRQEAKDRLRSQHDYKINLKAELEIRHLHEKVDHLLSHQWERLVRIQELQVELLSDLGRRR
ncbi:DUF1003 domain-containing protein [Fulvimonas yonginensis]|uniref:DUF1003 domain-containing protein n=1 Tax=Fulvimonas yonginensis TaxID=1495200 RepID=A0ABU8JCF3_9GAMM